MGPTTMKQIAVILLIFLNSCVYDPPLNRITINGYTIGDSIDNGIRITEISNNWISKGVIIDNNKAKVWLFNNHIERIIIDSLNEKEAQSWKEKITKTYNLKPIILKNDQALTGLLQNAVEYYWFDSISRDRISILKDFENNPDSISYLWFENKLVAETYREYLFGPDEEYEYIIIEDDDD